MNDGEKNDQRSGSEKLMSEAAICADTLSARASHRVGPAESHMDACDRLAARLEAAFALVCTATAGDGKTFLSMNDSMQLNYLWAIEELLSAARVDAAIVIEQRSRP